MSQRRGHFTTTRAIDRVSRRAMNDAEKRDDDDVNDRANAKKDGEGEGEEDAGEARDAVANDDGIFESGHEITAKSSWDGVKRRAIVIEHRAKTDGDGVEYYVHYSELNKRLDEWIDEGDAEAFAELDGVVLGGGESGKDLASSANGSANALEMKTLTRNSKRRFNEIHNVDAPVEDLPPIDQMFEREHEEKTKVKNVHSIELGRHEMDTWYYSPYPDDFGKCSKLYVCRFCLKYMRKQKTCVRHRETCSFKNPPGKRIYRHEQGPGEPILGFWEIDGKHFKTYCQNLCLLAKLFLDHKTLYFDVEPFLFYILTESYDGDKTHDIVGYFSKEKSSYDDYNLACILTLPAYQRKGYGSFLISMSYELSRREGILGTPERPLSDLGQVSYRSYWSRVVLDALHKNRGNLSVKDLSQMLMFREDDIVSALQSLNLIKYWKGQHIIAASPKIVEEHLKSFQNNSITARSRLEFNPELLTWQPPQPPAVKK